MTVEKKITTATGVAASSNVVAAINDRINRVETAVLGTSSFALVGTSSTLTAAQFYDGAIILLTGTPSGNHTLNVPASQHVVTFVNTTDKEVTVSISGQAATAPVIPPKSADSSLSSLQGQQATIRSNGVDARWLGSPIFAMSAAEYAALSLPSAGAAYFTV